MNRIKRSFWLTILLVGLLFLGFVFLHLISKPSYATRLSGGPTNAETIDGIDSDSFVRSDIPDTANNLTIGKLNLTGDLLDDQGNTIWNYSVQEIPDSVMGSIDNSTLTNNSVTVAGNSVSLGNSTSVALPDLSDLDSAAQGDSNVLASGGSNYREEAIPTLTEDHVDLADLKDVDTTVDTTQVGFTDQQLGTGDSPVHAGQTITDDNIFGLGTGDDYTLQYNFGSSRFELANSSGDILRVNDGGVDADFQGDGYFGGRLGVGTTNPQVKGHVSGGNFRVSASVPKFELSRTTTTDKNFEFQVLGSAFTISQNNDTFNNSTELLRLQTDGDLGLSATPSSRLDLGGGNISAIGQNKYADSDVDGNPWKEEELASADGSASAGDFQIYSTQTGSTGEVFIKDMAGNQHQISPGGNVTFGQVIGDSISLVELTGDPDTVANRGQIYSKDSSGTAEIFVQDDAGNVTQLSSHDKKGNYIINATNFKGEKFRVDLEKMLKELDSKLYKDYVKDDGWNVPIDFLQWVCIVFLALFNLYLFRRVNRLA